ASAALALGRLGRRRIPLDDAARAALRARAADPERDVRYAVLYALAREHGFPGRRVDDPDVVALTSRMVDPDPEIRATVIAGLGRRQALGDAELLFVAALDDRDPRVVVEVVRALCGDGGSDDARDVLAQRLLLWANALTQLGDTAAFHPLLEGLRLIAPFARRPAIATALDGVVREAARALASSDGPAGRAAGRVHCHATAALERARPSGFDGGARVMACGGSQVARAERAALLAEASLGMRDDGADAAARVADVARALLGSAEAGVRAAGLTMVAPAWSSLADADRGLFGETLAQAIAATAPLEVSAAADALGALLRAVPPGQTPPATLDRATHALVGRAGAEEDPELAAALQGVVGEAQLRAGAPACRTAAGAPSVVRARAGRACAAALGQTIEAPTTAAAGTPPPVDVDDVLGMQVRWTVVTDRGALVMELDPALAPWNVATLVTLTRRGFFDGLTVHRVVPGFVIQTGDPTATGWGGPGFTVPSEPSTLRDGAGFVTGAVGIADAGKDSGGSQWFVTTGPAPHLGGTYTQVGRLVEGLDVASRLVVGDTLVRATVELTPAPPASASASP
ncbi:MAG: peptidylprolyl isomerase, partial [Kofleriaceae bacterium]